MINSTRTIEDLSSADLELLAQLLCLKSSPPLESWLSDQSHLIKTFPPALIRPSSPLTWLLNHLPLHAPRAILCPTHKPLNPHLIRHIFLQISAEVTTRVQRLKSKPDLSHKLRDWLASLQTLNSLWMSSEIYRTVFGVMPEEKRFVRIPNGCEACILSCIGGSVQALMDLRGSVLGRKKRRRAVPQLSLLLEAWIDWSGEGDVIRRVSDEVGQEARHVRKHMQRERRKSRKDERNSMRREAIRISAAAPLPLIKHTDDYEHDTGCGEEGGDAEMDFEGSIISFYRNILPTTNVLQQNNLDFEITDRTPIHSAFQDSIPFQPTTGTSQERRDLTSSQILPIRDSFYPRSEYSRDSGFGDAFTTSKLNVGRAYYQASDPSKPS